MDLEIKIHKKVIYSSVCRHMQWHRKRHLSLDTFHKSHARTSKRVKSVLLRLLSPLLQLLPHALCQCLQQHVTKRATSRRIRHFAPAQAQGCPQRELVPWARGRENPDPAATAA